MTDPTDYEHGWRHPRRDQADVNRRGADLCRSVLDCAPGPRAGRARVYDPDDPVRDAAVRRARLERRGAP